MGEFTTPVKSDSAGVAVRDASGSADVRLPEMVMKDPTGTSRYVVAGTRSHMVCTQDGLCPPMGWHIKGEMGGVWVHGRSSAFKVADGHWLSIDGELLADPKEYASGMGYSRFVYEIKGKGLEVERTDLAPDSVAGVAVQYRVNNKQDKAIKLTVRLDVKMDLVAPYPWEWNGAPEATTRDSVRFDNELGALVAEDDMVTRAHDRDENAILRACAVAGASMQPEGIVHDDFTRLPEATIDPTDKGKVMSLIYEIDLPPNGSRDFVVAFAGSDADLVKAKQEYNRLIADFDALLKEKIQTYRGHVGLSRLDSPSDLIDKAFEWSKVNLAMDEAEVPGIGRGVVAGFPDYPWFFANDGAYTIYSLIATGRHELAKEHLRLIAQASAEQNGGSGKIVHEVVSNGTVFFGCNDDPGNANETAQFIMALGEAFRWTGDEELLGELYPMAKQGMEEFLFGWADLDGDLFPEGGGMVEREGMGPEKLGVVAYTYSAMGYLADMARAAGDEGFAAELECRSMELRERFEGAWWMNDERCFADSLGEEGEQIFQGFWTLTTPFETGLAHESRAGECLARLTGEEFTKDGGIYHNIGLGGVDADERRWTLPAGSMAIGLINYSMPDAALAPMEAIAGLIYNEAPGALDEIMPPTDKKPLTELPNFQQAWSTYGIVWPAVAGFAGVAPDVPNGRVGFVPNPPNGWDEFSLKDIAVGKNRYALRYEGSGRKRRVSVEATEVGAPYALEVGATIPEDMKVASVSLNGEEIGVHCYRIAERNGRRVVLVQVPEAAGSADLLVRLR